MSIRSTSSSGTSQDSFNVGYCAVKRSAPSLESIEQLLRLEAAIQEEISVRLSLVSTGLRNDIGVLEKCAYGNVRPQDRRSSLIGQAEAVLLQHENVSRRSEMLKDKLCAVRERYVNVKRHSSELLHTTERETSVVRGKNATLAKADKALNEASRLIEKVDLPGKIPGRAILKTPNYLGGPLPVQRPKGAFPLYGGASPRASYSRPSNIGNSLFVSED